MNILKFIITICREQLQNCQIPREPESSGVLNNFEQINTYTESGKTDKLMLAFQFYNANKINKLMKGCKLVVDLGCGSGNQLNFIAGLNPEIHFIGVDLSDIMLKKASKAKNITFIRGDITSLKFLKTSSVDGVISTLALHHLSSLEELNKCFNEISRILHPNGLIYLIDFGRLKSLKSVQFFANINANCRPEVLRKDLEQSLRAAFLKTELKNSVKLLQNKVKVCSTPLIPLLVTIRSKVANY